MAKQGGGSIGIATEGTLAAFADPKARAAMQRAIPLGRFGEPDEIAAAIAFLVSDDASSALGAVQIADDLGAG